MRNAWFIARKDVRYMLGDWEMLLWLFVMPVVFVYFIGTVTSGFGGGSGVKAERVTVQVPQSGGFLVDQVMRRLKNPADCMTTPRPPQVVHRSGREPLAAPLPSQV